jgi:hypothetical protein
MPQISSYPSGTKVELYKSPTAENFERAEAYWSGNDFIVRTARTGAGVFGTMNFTASVVRANAAQVEVKGHTHTAADVVGARSWAAVPANATATGTAGQEAYDANFHYICVATNVWRRVALTAW